MCKLNPTPNYSATRTAQARTEPWYGIFGLIILRTQIIASLATYVTYVTYVQEAQRLRPPYVLSLLGHMTQTIINKPALPVCLFFCFPL